MLTRSRMAGEGLKKTGWNWVKAFQSIETMKDS
jgi:hypothetical protein